MDIGLTAKLKPEIDERQTDRQASKLRQKFQEAIEGVQGNFIGDDVFDRAEEVQEQLDDFDMTVLDEFEDQSFAMDIIGGGGPASASQPQPGGDGGGGILSEVLIGEVVGEAIDMAGSALGGRAATAGSSAIAGRLAGISAGLGTLGTALLGGAALVGITGLALFALSGILSTLSNHSPLLESVMSMLGLATSLFFRPFGNILGRALLPVARGILGLASQFNTVFGREGLDAALRFLGGQIVDGVLNALWTTTLWLGHWLEDVFDIDISFADLISAIKAALKKRLGGIGLGGMGLGLLASSTDDAAGALARLKNRIPGSGRLSFLSRLKPLQTFKKGLRGVGKFLAGWGKAFIADIPLIGNQLKYFGSQLRSLGKPLGRLGTKSAPAARKALDQYKKVLGRKAGQFLDSASKKTKSLFAPAAKAIKKRVPNSIQSALGRAGKLLPNVGRGGLKAAGKKALGPLGQAAFFLPEAMRKSEGGFTGEEAGGLLGGLGGSLAGFSVGAKAGGAAGATAGSVIPGAGTAAGGLVGAGVGGIAGAVLGEKVGRQIGQKVGNSIPELKWEYFVPNVPWGDIIPDFNIGSMVDSFSWSSVTKSLQWSPFIPSLNWTNYINELLFGSYIKILKWASFVKNLEWPGFVKNLEWPSFVDAVPWTGILDNVPWTGIVTDVSWRRILTDVSWPRILTDVSWPGILTGVSWTRFIPSVNWNTWIPNVNWGSFIPNLDWGRFIPNDLSLGGGGGGGGGDGGLIDVGLASGGIVTGPTRALVGEGSESEAVLPLSRLQSFVEPPAESMSLGTSSITVDMSLDGSTGIDEQQVADAISASISSQLQNIDDGVNELVRRIRRGEMSGPVKVTADGKKIAEVSESGLNRYTRSNEVTK